MNEQYPNTNHSIKPPSSKKKRDEENRAEEKSAEQNWYAKLHPMGKHDDALTTVNKRKNLLNLSLFFRIWLAVGIIIIISGIVIFNQLFNYVRPVTQQVIEDTLVDTAMLLSASLQAPMQSGEIKSSQYKAMLDTAFALPNLPDKQNRYASPHELDILDTWYHHKTHSSFRVYVTDAKGHVVYDSLAGAKNAEGKDYSKWNDVYLTLQGKYGARTTRSNKDDQSTSVMYVAQPIYAPNSANQEIIGVVSVGKPTATVLPYLDATRQRMLSTSLFISIITLVMAGLVAWWLKQSMMLVTRYTQSLAQDAKKPYFYLASELNELTDTIEDMKHRLENKAYVNDYVHTLTHELKSPLTAIRASGELLEASDLEDEDRLMLSQTITEQSIKLQSLIDRLLLLAKIEQPTFKLAIQTINPDELIRRLITNYEIQCLQQQVHIDYNCDLTDSNIEVLADEFWLTQALQNIIDNAVYFSHSHVVIHLTDHKRHNDTSAIEINIFNDGDLIPDYALSKVFDRYFSLSHQHNKAILNRLNEDSSIKSSHAKKGTGLGLTLVKQVIERHDGHIVIHNIQAPDVEDNRQSAITANCDSASTSGVLVCIHLPIKPKKTSD